MRLLSPPFPPKSVQRAPVHGVTHFRKHWSFFSSWISRNFWFSLKTFYSQFLSLLTILSDKSLSYLFRNKKARIDLRQFHLERNDSLEKKPEIKFIFVRKTVRGLTDERCQRDITSRGAVKWKMAARGREVGGEVDGWRVFDTRDPICVQWCSRGS